LCPGYPCTLTCFVSYAFPCQISLTPTALPTNFSTTTPLVPSHPLLPATSNPPPLLFLLAPRNPLSEPRPIGHRPVPSSVMPCRKWAFSSRSQNTLCRPHPFWSVHRPPKGLRPQFANAPCGKSGLPMSFSPFSSSLLQRPFPSAQSVFRLAHLRHQDLFSV